MSLFFLSSSASFCLKLSLSYSSCFNISWILSLYSALSSFNSLVTNYSYSFVSKSCLSMELKSLNLPDVSAWYFSFKSANSYSKRLILAWCSDKRVWFAFIISLIWFLNFISTFFTARLWFPSFFSLSYILRLCSDSSVISNLRYESIRSRL